MRCREAGVGWSSGGGAERKGRLGYRQTAVGSRGEKVKGMGCFFFFFGSEVAVVVALARLASVVPSLSVAVPLVLPALPPALVVVAPVAVGSSGWWSKKKKAERRGERR